jgi:hypothetical protein
VAAGHCAWLAPRWRRRAAAGRSASCCNLAAAW